MQNTKPFIFERQHYFATLLVLVAVLILTALVYGPYLSSPLVFDDKPYFTGPFVARCASEIDLFGPRFLACASFAHQYFLQGPSFEPLRWGNLLFHAVAAWVLYLLIVELLITATTLDQPYIRWSALAVVILFIIHPAHVYAVGYLVERSIIMATLGSLLMWWTWLKVITSANRRWLVLMVLAYYFAVFSKEHAIFALAGPIALSILLRKQYPKPNREMLLSYFLCVSLGILVIHQRSAILGSLYEPMGQEVLQSASGADIYLRSIQTQCGLFFKYLSIWLLPEPIMMSVDMREPILSATWSVEGFGYVTAYLAYGISALLLLFRGGYIGLFGFGMLMPWVLFSTEFSSVRLQEIFVLYRGYLWFSTLAIPLALLGAIACGYGWARWLAAVIFVSVSYYFVGATQNRLATFTSSYALWNDALSLIEKQSTTPMFAERAYHNRGNAMFEAGYPTLALIDIDRALKLNDSLCSFHRTRATVLLRLKRVKEAKNSFSRTLFLCPTDAVAYFGRFKTEDNLGLATDAAADLSRACQLNLEMACFVESRLKSGVTLGQIFKFDVRSPKTDLTSASHSVAN